MPRKSFATLLIAGPLALAVPSPPAMAQSKAITINSRPLALFDAGVPDNRFGPLTFLGGLVLDSPNRQMRALSGLAMNGDTLLMVTDEGNWVAATLEATPEGVPIGLTDAQLGPLLGSDGAPMLSKSLADAEALTLVDGALWVAAERNQPLRAYQIEEGAPSGPASLPFGEAAPLQGGRNQGLEAMVHVETGPLAGETLVFLEEAPRAASAPTAARLTADGQIIPFAVRRQDGFAITGAAALPGGDIMLLERRFGWQSGLFMRLRHLSAQAILGGAAPGRLVLHADGATQIDNMEGIAVSDHPAGPILTLISDDNGNFFQRSVLLRFQVTGSLEGLEAAMPPAPVARPTP